MNKKYTKLFNAHISCWLNKRNNLIRASNKSPNLSILGKNIAKTYASYSNKISPQQQ